MKGVFGPALSDVPAGDAGNNRLCGSAGADVPTGERGADVFHAVNGAGIDRVTVLEDGLDRIGLSNSAGGTTGYLDIDEDIAPAGASVQIVIGGTG